MIINEKALRVFAQTLLFENKAYVNLNELNMSPSTGPGANDEFKSGRHIYNQAGPQIDGDGNYPLSYPVEEDDQEESNEIEVSDSSSIQHYYADYDEIEPKTSVDLKLSISSKIDDELGMDLSAEEIAILSKKINKIFKEVV